VKDGLLHEIVLYETKLEVPAAEKIVMVSSKATQMDLTGTRPQDVGNQFINEVMKREIGRQKCLEAECDLYMSLDCDELYEGEPLRRTCEQVFNH